MFDWIDLIVGGVIIGFFVNIASSLAYPKILNFFEKRKMNSDKARQERARAVDELLKNPELELRQRIDRVYSIVFFGTVAILQTLTLIGTILFFAIAREDSLTRIVCAAMLLILTIGSSIVLVSGLRERNKTYYEDALETIDKDRKNRKENL